MLDGDLNPLNDQGSNKSIRRVMQGLVMSPLPYEEVFSREATRGTCNSSIVSGIVYIDALVVIIILLWCYTINFQAGATLSRKMSGKAVQVKELVPTLLGMYI